MQREHPAWAVLAVVTFGLLVASLITRSRVLTSLAIIAVGAGGIAYGWQLRRGGPRTAEGAGSLLGAGIAKAPAGIARIVWMLLGTGIVALGVASLVVD